MSSSPLQATALPARRCRVHSCAAHVFLVEDHALYRSALSAILTEDHDIEVVAATSTSEFRSELTTIARVDVILFVRTSPIVPVLEFLENPGERSRCVPVMVACPVHPPDVPMLLLRSGARGCVPLDVPASTIRQAVREVCLGRRYITDEIRRLLLDGYLDGGNERDRMIILSAREVQVLACIAEGRRNGETADVLGVSKRTIDTYRSRLLEKLRLRNNADLTRFAVQRGLVQMDT